ncbi:helix-turn-helix domain-containing protein [Clostridium perfringens]|nr:helix-turn-helix domain-containing protein [Clostridium perfringens]
MRRINEKKLITLVKKNNDKKAAGEIVKFYYKEIFAYVFRQTSNEELSKDLTQEIFISMLKSLEDLMMKKLPLGHGFIK